MKCSDVQGLILRLNTLHTVCSCSEDVSDKVKVHELCDGFTVLYAQSHTQYDVSCNGIGLVNIIGSVLIFLIFSRICKNGKSLWSGTTDEI